jgi:hypothetical protein
VSHSAEFSDDFACQETAARGRGTLTTLAGKMRVAAPTLVLHYGAADGGGTKPKTAA